MSINFNHIILIHLLLQFILNTGAVLPKKNSKVFSHCNFAMSIFTKFSLVTQEIASLASKVKAFPLFQTYHF